MPLDESRIAALVVVNMGNQPIPLEIVITTGLGDVLLRDTDSYKALDPYEPLALLLDDLVPDSVDRQQHPWVSVRISSENGSLVGAAFSFNAQREPAINNAITVGR